MNSLSVPSIFLGDSLVSRAEKEKYLGTLISDKFLDNDDIDREIRAIYARGNYLIRSFRRCDDNTKSVLFSTYCSNLYCSALWSNYSNTVLQRLVVAYNNVFRKLFYVDRRASVSFNMVFRNITHLKVILRKYSHNFMSRLFSLNNSIVIALRNWADFPISPFVINSYDIMHKS